MSVFAVMVTIALMIGAAYRGVFALVNINEDMITVRSYPWLSLLHNVAIIGILIYFTQWGVTNVAV